MCDSSVMIINL